MALFPFYNVRKPKQFEHKYIYYDPRKEALEERKLKVKRELGLEITPEEYKPHIKGTFMEGTTHLKKSYMKGDDVRSRMYKSGRLVLFATLLALVLWYLLR
ncbi:MAG: hypothetical protein LBH04_10360 [Tannerellaceae bacterium]|jgi:hypothetical protein|nr:hypothetical protein [Tannerellaceae bacterium]